MIFRADSPSCAVQQRNDTIVGAHLAALGRGPKWIRVGRLDWSSGRRTSHITRPVQLQSRQIVMQYYEYIAGDNWVASNRGIYVE